jgi:septum site-determining protein MinD
MATRIITITSGKGGVGKTTTTANLGVALASLGQRVVVVDTDVGLRNLDILLGLQNRIIYDVVDVIEGRCRLRQALIRDRVQPELYLLPASQTREKSAVRPSDLSRVCDQLQGSADIVLLDSPAGIEHGFRIAVAPASEFVVVTTPDQPAIQDADRVLGILEESDRRCLGLVVNRVHPDMIRRQETPSPEEIAAMLSIPLLGAIPDDDQIMLANTRGEPIAHDRDSGPGSLFVNVARRLLGEEIPVAPLREARPTWLQRLGLAR